MQEMTRTKASNLLSSLARIQDIRLSSSDRHAFIKKVREAFHKSNGAFYFIFNGRSYYIFEDAYKIYAASDKARELNEASYHETLAILPKTITDAINWRQVADNMAAGVGYSQFFDGEEYFSEGFWIYDQGSMI